MDTDRLEIVARRLGALGEPTRLQLVLELCSRESGTVRELADAVGGSLPNVSKHLRHLHQVGLVTRQKEGTFAHYELANEHLGPLVRAGIRILGSLRRPR